MKTGLFFRTSYIIQRMSASLGLFRLQQVDSQIDRIRTQLDAIRKTLENDSELREALERVEATRVEQHRTLHDMKTVEAEAMAQKIKIEQAESSLYGGSVTNPKELQDLQKDVASLKKHLATLEERQLEAMLAAEITEAEFETAKTTLEVLQSKLGGEHQKLLDERTVLTEKMESLAEEREASVTPIDGELLQTYEHLRRQKRGLAVAEMEDNACAVCGTNLNAATQQTARSQKQLAHCPSCGRILFAH
jgi:uncharacterized protein